MKARPLTIFGLILTAVFLPLVVFAQVIEIPLPSPGRLGMISNVGASEVPLEAMRYSLNVDTWTNPGVLSKRVGLTYYGGTHSYLYGASGYYNPYDNHKLVVGVHDSTYLWFDTLLAAHSSLVGQFFVSDTFRTNPNVGVSGLVFPYRDAYHDWLPYKDMLIHCDGKSIPAVFTTSQTFFYQDSAFDTSGFQPRAISMGLEAPGQLRVGLTDAGADLHGNYRYSYAYYNAAADTTGGLPVSKMALPSAVVSPDGEAPYLTQFEDHYLTSDSIDIIVLRQKLDGRNKWNRIDTIHTELELDSNVMVVNVVFSYQSNNHGWPNYKYWVKIVTDSGTSDSIAYTTGTTTPASTIRDSMKTAIRNGVLADSLSVTHFGFLGLVLTAKVPLAGFTVTTDTSGTVTTVLDTSYYSPAGRSELVYVDRVSDTAAVSQIYGSYRCTVEPAVWWQGQTYTVSIGYNGDTQNVQWEQNTIEYWPLSTVVDSIVAQINTDDSLSLRFTAYGYNDYYDIVPESTETQGLIVDSVITDNLQTAVRHEHYPLEWDPAQIDTTMRQPGGLLRIAGSTDTLVNYFPMLDSSYNIAYSYYDPATGFESPLGPTTYTTLVGSSIGTDSVWGTRYSTGWPASGRPGWIRLYQGVVTTGLTGAGDTTYWYGLYQLRTNGNSQNILWGNWADDSVVVGLDTSLIANDTIYSYQQFWTVSGDEVVQPPYHYDLQIPFSDMERAHFRFYGIGDPMAPNRIYYTPVDTISWYATDYFEIQPGSDEFVALEQLNDVLYAFKHNSVWYLAGYPAEQNTAWGRITGSSVEVRQLSSAFGAVSREAVVKYQDAIYFMTTTGKIMAIDGQGLREISQPVQNWIDTLFKASLVVATYQADYDAFSKYGALFGADNQLKVVNDSSGRLLSYYIPLGLWGEQKYTSFIPTRMIEYDSTRGLVGNGETELYTAIGTDAFRMESPTGSMTDASGNFEWAAEFSVPGDGLGYYSVQRMNFRMEPRSYWFLRYTIYDADGDSLASDSIYSTVGNNRFLSWHVKQHDLTMYPFVRLWGKTGETTTGGDPQPIPNRFDIESIIFTVRTMGGEQIQ